MSKDSKSTGDRQVLPVAAACYFRLALVTYPTRTRFSLPTPTRLSLLAHVQLYFPSVSISKSSLDAFARSYCRL